VNCLHHQQSGSRRYALHAVTYTKNAQEHGHDGVHHDSASCSPCCSWAINPFGASPVAGVWLAVAGGLLLRNLLGRFSCRGC